MPKFKIGREYGTVGSSHEEIVECDNLKDAEEWAHDAAMERVSYWVIPVDDDGEEI